MRTIKQFIKKADKVYFYMKDKETCQRFYRDAEREGITFCGQKPTQKETTDIIALLPEGEICYVGCAGHMCFHHGGMEGVIRIDYAKYADNDEEFILKWQ